MSDADAGAAERREQMAGAVRRWAAVSAELEAAQPTQAASLGGGRFQFEAPPGMAGVRPGDLVAIGADDGHGYLGEIVEARLVRTEGPRITREMEATRLGLLATPSQGDALSLEARLDVRRLMGEGILLMSTGDDGRPQRPDASTVFLDAPMRPATHEEVARYLRVNRAAGATMEVGVARGGGGDPVHLFPDGFLRHTFLCGQSGSGKSFALGVLVEQLLARTPMRVVVIDPNSDLVRITERRTRAEADATRAVPFDDAAWAEVDAALDAALAGTSVLRPRTRAQAEVLALAFGRLDERAGARVLGLDPLADREEYAAFADGVARLPEDGDLDRLLDEVGRVEGPAARDLALRIRNLGIAGWDIWARAGEGDMVGAHLTGARRCIVADVGTLGTEEERATVAEAVLGHLWDRRADRIPTMIVIDEAHNVCPAAPGPGIAAAALDHVIRIAAEGRKYGLLLLLASQRPTRVHPDVLTQCENLVLMRTVAHVDLLTLRDAFSHIPAGLVEQAATFGKGEALVGGGIADAPLPVRFGGRLTREGGSDVRLG
jgi:DNA helicase HerA-like ATPase